MELNINIKFKFDKKKKRLSGKKSNLKLTTDNYIQIVGILITLLGAVINNI